MTLREVTVGALRELGVATGEIEAVRFVYGAGLGGELNAPVMIRWSIRVLPWSRVVAVVRRCALRSAIAADVIENRRARRAISVLSEEADEAEACAAQKSIEHLLASSTSWGGGCSLGETEQAAWCVLRNVGKLVRRRVWGSGNDELARILGGIAEWSAIATGDAAGDAAIERMAMELLDEVVAFVRSWAPGPAGPQ